MILNLSSLRKQWSDNVYNIQNVHILRISRPEESPHNMQLICKINIKYISAIFSKSENKESSLYPQIYLSVLKATRVDRLKRIKWTAKSRRETQHYLAGKSCERTIYSVDSEIYMWGDQNSLRSARPQKHHHQPSYLQTLLKDVLPVWGRWIINH